MRGPLLVRGVGRQVEQQRPNLRAEEVVGAGGPERGQARRRLGGQEVEHHVRVVEMPDHGPVATCDSAHCRGQPGCAGAALVDRKRGERPPRRAEWIGAPEL